MNKSKKLSNMQKPANCGYTVLPAGAVHLAGI